MLARAAARSGSRRSSVLVHTLDGINNLVDKLQRDSRDDALRIGECALQRAERNPCLLCGDTREQLLA